MFEVILGAGAVSCGVACSAFYKAAQAQLKMTRHAADRVGDPLRDAYAAVVAEPVPEALTELLDSLGGDD